jgi:hypothetical protein
MAGLIAINPIHLFWLKSLFGEEHPARQHPGERLNQDGAACFRGHHLPNCWVQQERHGAPTVGSTVLGVAQLQDVDHTV